MLMTRHRVSRRTAFINAAAVGLLAAILLLAGCAGSDNKARETGSGGSPAGTPGSSTAAPTEPSNQAVQAEDAPFVSLAMTELKARDAYATYGIKKISSVTVRAARVTGNEFLGNKEAVGEKAEAKIVRLTFDGKYHAGQYVELYYRTSDKLFMGGTSDK